ncbi:MULTISPECIES: tRNA uridine-5-carboxymethylaminomethyl(34) synthesis GTPase MnmE [Marinobacter]|jgi:tRNA modification GTPase|uniref:tRNA modification GTPase MnmE n=2 Tax=Marinobacter TaxID=2742 RepID=A0A455VZF5_MARNT|nr:MULTISPECIES: tRNA uridine-5-carboxymethylaminomethyl(34) synthesis GTPase MnmE [Marinobacter]WBU41320.1 tRNA uridine-5-carboxymethylaminomethyl(34) synthesis GTPase MnmE [Marinobacter alkaliphilus]BBJ02204.1 tRNA modification GTPase MnmE [Marinobacter nauticus]KXO07441.1 GTPase and tRNA-U34 5-formylation enzyme TrmE [Marinobacter excellens LAMA 842]MAO15065.1 tRNA uridine-5-carboxymethylaminomethyl(34) synthesis GTPase MnmE [Marinobacter sp.]PSF13186.1 tRNA uridine-5-carboxymethylaminometh|tara:strand:+ start:114 stop:1484 length:1371 start_codon:yes stop_codon:yes gene_type:complete
MQATTDTIAAIATAPGQAGVGIVRVSGPKAVEIARNMLGFEPRPRYAHYGPFHDSRGELIDEGIGLYFPNPHSFTGEDVFELQGHGGTVILDMLLREVCSQGARLARPGEFSERAFLNDKLDLAQAEAIADLIESSSEQAARCAVRSMQGVFSRRIDELVDAVTHLRIYVEAAIDFPEEEIDFLADGKVAVDLQGLLQQVEQILSEAQQGTILRDGMKVVIAGRPNAGKSSLLNALAGREAAIVTAIEGTTRDVLREHIHIDGMPLHIIDTAGLRDSPDEVEQIGIARAWDEIRQADRILLMVDATTTDKTEPHEIWPDFIDQLPASAPVTVIRNKVDLSGEPVGISAEPHQTAPVIRLAAKGSEGLDTLRTHLKECIGFASTTEGGFLARRRHLDALERARDSLLQGQTQLEGYGAGELLAEDLRAAQDALGEITGHLTPDDLLGKIFSSFCIGK